MMSNKRWLSPEPDNLPDFIICGAMKSGTTSMHEMLEQHPNIFIPKKEVHFFDQDNLVQHPDFHLYQSNTWYSPILANDEQQCKFWENYSARFSSSKAGQVTGEDSTTYLASPTAFKRIAEQQKTIKIIVMLRHPSKRAISNYWHLLRSGRAPYSLEKTLMLQPESILGRSNYCVQLRSLYKYISREKVKIVAFENFIKNKEKVMSDVCQFLGVDYRDLPKSAFEQHANETTYPRFLWLQLLKNRLFPMAGNGNYSDVFSLLDKESATKAHFTFTKLINGFHRRVNPLVPGKPCEISKDTQMLLDGFFEAELSDINKLVEQDLFSLWFNNKSDKSSSS